MAARDVIVSAFATPPGSIEVGASQYSKREIAQPLDAFVEEPVLVQVDATRMGNEGFYDKAFGREAARYRDESGSILRRFLASHLSGVEVRRIAVVAFSAGGVFASKLLGSPDATWIDSVIMLDALHLQKSWEGAPSFLEQSIGPWANFGVRAARSDGPMLVLAHTEIARPAPTVGSTQESAQALSSQVAANSPGAPRTGIPGVFFEGPPPPAVTLGPAQGLPPPERTYAEIPMPSGVGRGDYHAYDFGGTVGADHAFIAWFVQGAVWRGLLAPRWNAGLDCPQPVSGLGQARACGPQGVVVPPGTYPIPESVHWGWAAAGLAIGVGVGYAATHGPIRTRP